MAIKTFEKILADAKRANRDPGPQSADWFRDIARKTRTKPEVLMRNADAKRLVYRPEIGRMYSFFYDPKHKKTLPYYDTFPLIFPIDTVPKGFMGINFHYLPYALRAKLMDALYNLRTNNAIDENTQLRMSYSLLKGSSRFDLFKPALKMYLNSHVQSRFVEIFANEWDIALMLPLARFEKANYQTVWRDSRNAI
jgi:hypothetical protein